MGEEKAGLEGTMGLFKSKEERRIERDMEIRKGLTSVRRNIRSLEKNEKEYIKKAVRAKRIDSPTQLEFLKKTLKKTASQRRLLERQLLNIETAIQIKNQAEAYAQFAKSMNAVSRSISEMFGYTDLAQTQKDFETAMSRAQSMEERMELFLDMSSESMFGFEAESMGDLVTDEEIDKLIEDEAAHVEGEEADSEIDEGLKEIRKELEKDKS